MSDGKPDRVLKALVAWITYLLVFSWLPLVRILFDGESYRWGTSHFGFTYSAAGWEPDAWLLVFKSALLIGLLIGALRVGGGRVFRVGLLAWAAVLAADVVIQFMLNPAGFEFHGDTLGIHFNIGWPVVIVAAVFAGLALFWFLGDARRDGSRRPPPWTRANTRGLGLFLVLLPIQFLLLRAGEPHGATDAAGVIITITSVPLLAWALWPRRPDRID